MKYLILLSLIPSLVLADNVPGFWCLDQNGVVVHDYNLCAQNVYNKQVEEQKQFTRQQMLMEQYINGQIELANIDARARINSSANLGNVPMPNTSSTSINNGSGSTSGATSSNTNSLSNSQSQNQAQQQLQEMQQLQVQIQQLQNEIRIRNRH